MNPKENASVIHSSKEVSVIRYAEEIHYILMDPTGNVTLLVLDPVPPEKQPAVAAELMKKEPLAEQAGFLSFPADPSAPVYAEGVRSDCFSGNDPVLALRMAGGEFCGNASMSTAAFLAWKGGLDHGQFKLCVSGASAPVLVEIEAAGEDLTWNGKVHMPPPKTIETIRFPDGKLLPVVTFDGITHVILPYGNPDHSDDTGKLSAHGFLQDPQKKEAEMQARQWCHFLQADALGLMFLDRSAAQLTPLVYVPAADTLFWETSCGSGSAAAGAWLASRERHKISISLKQPGGTLRITASPDGPLILQGTVRLLKK